MGILYTRWPTEVPDMDTWCLYKGFVTTGIRVPTLAPFSFPFTTSLPVGLEMSGNNRQGHPYGLEPHTRGVTPAHGYPAGAQSGPTFLPPGSSPASSFPQDSRQNSLVYTIERQAASRERSQLPVHSIFSGTQIRSSLSSSAGTYAQRLYASAKPKEKEPSLPSQNIAYLDESVAPPRSANHRTVNRRHINLGPPPAEQQIEALSRDFSSKAVLLSSSPPSPHRGEEWDRYPGISDKKRAVPSHTIVLAPSRTSPHSHDHPIPSPVIEAPQYEAPASSWTIPCGGPSEVPPSSENAPVNVIQSSTPDTAPTLGTLPPDSEDVAEEVPPYTLVDETPPPPELDADLADADAGHGELSAQLNSPASGDSFPVVPSYTSVNPPPVSFPDPGQRARSPAVSTANGTTQRVCEPPSVVGRNERSGRQSTISSRSSSTTLNIEFATDLYGHSYGRQPANSIRERTRSTSSHANTILAPPPPLPPLMFPLTTATDGMMAMHGGRKAGISPISTRVTPPPFPSKNTSHMSMQLPGDSSSWNHYHPSDGSAIHTYPTNTTGMFRRPTGDSTLQPLPTHSSLSSPSSSPISPHSCAPQHSLYPAPQQPPRKLRRPPPVPNRVRRPSTAPYSPSGTGGGFQIQQTPGFPLPGPW